MFFLKALPTRAILDRYAERYPEMNVGNMEEALALLRKASRLMRELEAYFALHDLSQTRFLILILLDREPDQDTFVINDLVERLDVSKPVITKAVQSLEKEGFLSLEASATDRRAKLIALRDSGRKKLDSVMPGYYQIINAAFEDA